MSLELNNIDLAFLRFQQSGNPDHLGEVFDGTATRLLESAQHLTSDMNAADDLVQATYLTAIECRTQYKPKGHVISWLFGILVNRARLHRRSQGRDVLSNGGQEQLQTLMDLSKEGPSELLQRQETSEMVRQAISNMPESLRLIMNLHIRYGLSAAEIAASMERPAGSIRKQISRGINNLRKALPASLIAGAVVLTTPVTGLATMREVILNKAAVSLAAQSATSTSSALALGKLVLGVAAGTLTAAALAVSLFAPDRGQVTLDELSPQATAQVVAQKGSVDSFATASVALQADPFSPSSRVLLAISNPETHAPGGVDPMTNNMNFPFSLTQNLGISSLLLGAMTLLPTLGQGQNVIYNLEGENGDDRLGSAVGSAGDVNGDGYADIMVGVPNYDVDFDGPDNVVGPVAGPDGTLGTSDDVNDDEQFNGRVCVYSGANGLELWHFDGPMGQMRPNSSFSNWFPDGEQLGAAVSGAGDLNGDGIPDVVVNSPTWDVDTFGPDGTYNTADDNKSNGRVYALSGDPAAVTRVLWTFTGERNNDSLSAVSGAGDVNFDGYNDVVAGAFAYDPVGPDGTFGTADDLGQAGRVYALSGDPAAVTRTLWTFDGGVKFDLLGRSVGGGSDVDFDGFSDVFAGATGFDPAGPDGTSGTADDFLSGGRVYAFSGDPAAVTRTLWTYDGEAKSDLLGQSVSGNGDMDIDGFVDVVAGAYRYDSDPDGTAGSGDEVTDGGAVYALSGNPAAVTRKLWRFDGEGFGDRLGWAVSGTSDIDGDGYADAVGGAYLWDADLVGPDGTTGTGDESLNNGRTYALSGNPAAGTRVLWSFDGGADDWAGIAVSGFGDVNVDGIDDVVIGAKHRSDPAELGPDGTAGTGDETGEQGISYVISSSPLSLTADTHQLSLSVANSQTMTIDAGVVNAGKNYWLFTGFAASGSTPGVTMAPGVVIPLNQPDPLTSFVIGLTQLGGGAPTFSAWKSTLDGVGKASPSLNTFGPTPAPLGVTLHHAALIYTANGCGTGCDTFQLATNWVPMTTTP